ncbi:MAG: hypothetical protein KC582_01670 [Candidatus Magasanikbacteria bacterium]|nr:hypothetical protein [Candidatus Magasanikbacteria bacterium]MCA9389636.1 hypothetical protein [Candidatus Magasanikbacteria bacterium]MCA9390940.1 hypothetical protein [Candidatus Magasanikbacteria bacterium]USN52087.1 MAG: hypothetical protein H6759_03570 [Candidatus Nomurabacteria bacterium]HPF95422.1 glutamate-cysteine ligase family protein [bacterium]
MDKQSFFSQFRFNPVLAGAYGVEREFFLTDAHGIPVPRSQEFLARVQDPAWTYELSACQVEHRTAPEHSITKILSNLQIADAQARRTAMLMGADIVALEVAQEDMSIEIYPDNNRYKKLVKHLPKEMLRAACRVAGIHIHRGAKDLDDAISMYNNIVKCLEDFIKMGDHSQGERLRLYRQMAPNWSPPQYTSRDHFFEVACEQGFVNNPRNCWHLVRISQHGTVELRMFGMTNDLSRIHQWISVIDRVVLKY